MPLRRLPKPASPGITRSSTSSSRTVRVTSPRPDRSPAFRYSKPDPKTVMLSILLALILTVPVSLTAPDTTADRPGLLLMAHGGSPEWNASVEEAVAPLRSRYPVAVAFGMADPRSLDAALDSLSAQGVSQVAVVRLFMDGRSFLHQTEYRSE